MSYLLGISGSLRKASTNTKFVHAAAATYGGDFVFADLRLPLYDGDLEAEGILAEVQTLADQIAGAEAVVISTPEYNKNLPGVLKNALDWVSRTKGSPWRDKPVAIISAAAGRAGGERSQFSLRHCLTPFRPHLLPGPEVFLADSSNQFADDGTLANEFTRKLLDELMADLRKIARG